MTQDFSGLLEIRDGGLSPLFDWPHCLLHGGRRVVLGSARCNSVNEYGGHPLPDAPRGLGCRTVLDLAEHRYDVGSGDILDRGGAEVGKYVPFQRMENVISM